MSARPPRPATWLLHICLPPAERDEIVGDLLEEFELRASTSGRLRARGWVLWQSLRLAAASASLRRGVAGEPTNREHAFADFGSDLRLALRTMRRAPGLTAIALLSLVVSLGIATSVFSIVRSVLLKPLPIATVDRVVRLGSSPERWQDGSARLATIGGAPPPSMLTGTLVGAWLEQPGSLDAIATYRTDPRTVVIGSEPLRAIVCDVGAAFFQVLPVAAKLGRTLQAADGAPQAARVTVVSERLLSQRQVDASLVVGRTFAIEGVPHEVVGVLPHDFAYPDLSVDVWVVDRTRWPSPFEQRQMGHNALALGLLRAGAVAADAEREGQRMADAIVAAGGALSFEPAAVPRVSVTSLADELLRPVRPALTLIVLGTVGVLIAANVNLAGFLLSRHAARRRDLAMRQALGASTWRLVRPIVVEQLLLGTAAAVGALALAWLIVRALPAVAPHDLPRLSAVAVDFSSLVFAIGAALVTALVVGLLPARRLAAGDLRAYLSDGGTAVAGASLGAERTRRGLVTAQVAVATLLLVGAAFVGRSLMAMMRVDLGYDPGQVLTFQIGVPEAVAYGTRGRLTRLYSELLEQLRAHPGVISVGTSTGLPLHGDTLRSAIMIPGLTPPRTEGQPWPTSHFEYVDASYLQAIGATLAAGRFFTPEDTRSAMPVAIVNEAFVRAFMPGVEPLGQRVPRGVHRPTVVGVVKPIQRAASTNRDDAAMYVPAAQTSEQVAFGPSHAMGVAVRTSGPPMALLPFVQRLVRELEPAAPVYNAMALDQRVGRTFAQPRFFAVALALFSVLALATSLMGVYSVLSAAVERRRVEVGVRRALGATGGDVAMLVLGEAARLSVVGVVGGSLAAAAAAAIGRSALYGVSPADAVSYVAAAFSVLVVVGVAASVPMRAALRVDPARVLRAD